jgi:hypothetical protein
MEMADVIMVFARGMGGSLDEEALAELYGATNVEQLGEGVVSCTIPGSRFRDVQSNPSVAYIRRVANFMGSCDA